MRSVRILAAGAVGTLSMGLLTLVPAWASAPYDIPASCPADTVHSTELGGDDFNPATDRSLQWDLDPWGNYLDDPKFGVVQRDGAGQDGWLLHVDNPTTPGAVGAWVKSQIPLPEGRRIYAGVRHSYALDALRTEPQEPGDPVFTTPTTGASAVIPASPQAKYIASASVESRGFVTTSTDVSGLAGTSASPRLTIHQTREGRADWATGWDIDDIAIHTCDAATPSLPTDVTATGQLGAARLRWVPPSWHGTGGLTRYRITVSPGDRVIDNIPASATSAYVSGLARHVSYTFTLQAYSAAGGSQAVTRSLTGTKLTALASPSTISAGKSSKVSGKLYRADNSAALRGSTVVLQGRKKGTYTWNDKATTTTWSGSGEYAFIVRPSSSWQYRVLYRSGNGTYLGTFSVTRTVTVS